jgi:hypothetical protein
MHILRERNSSPNKIRFASMAVLTSSIAVACVDSSGRVVGNDRADTPDDVPSAYPGPAPIAPKAKAKKSFPLGYGMGCPNLMVRGGDYCIDRFEAYVVELKGGKEFPHPHSLPPKGKTLRAKVAYDEFPQSSINQFQAAQACQSAGKRLCTRSEWQRACKGAEHFKYPYGEQEEKGKCNTRKTHLLSELHGNDPRKWGNSMNDPLINFIPGFLAKAGDYADCVSSYGVYDMVGNLHEWVSTLVDSNTPSRKIIGKATPGFKASPGNGIFMGGFFSSANQNGQGCNYMTTVHGPDHFDYSTGFRCCKGVE